ncbi:hypothetical protein ASPWEDRAFT_99651 [Aspergillus wentii DTO 134E9]|uniref:AB hydrolase-1 domain-containing protein n=1 Tax=Aspergillus wentii DTO 134E9 TaxID=1073089 RepID=A0A1L9S319_ASPWE|nr:uncharacterized protein ASPWEDRAFT_99651 [Aspergillus wentii DTO 134E9]KAI9929888.1 hypothetical protein MW887_011696 [Aspergillus wentii]OJJ41539.1 hypothetical protein ASPWEDRAFT_99651 [Aspergillus wentii DTO 134E9]
MYLQEPQITPNTFFHITPASQPNQAPVIIYFISGNPGLISYYHPFLSFLSSKLSSWAEKQPKSQQDTTFQIYGRNLGGFDIGPEGENAEKDAPYYGLEEQICIVQERLEELVHSKDRVGANLPGGAVPKVILIGHSVGTYIAMEIMRRHRERRSSGFDIVGGVLLFPTVVDIAKSPSGQKLTKLLSFIPKLALVVGILVRILTMFLPDFILRACINLVMSSPPKDAVDSTLAFIKSKRGVRQALHMARDEMTTISADKWTDDIWGISTSKEPPAKLFFYFGRNDHWVEEKTRDEIIEVRGKVKGGPTMFVCDDGLPHAFCLKHSEVMATKVADMIKDIVS